MSVMAQVRFNYRDYCLMPEDKRYELIDGGLFMTPSPRTRHQIICSNLEYLFRAQLQDTGKAAVLRAPLDVYFSDEDVVQPDVLVIHKERDKIVEEKYVRGAPDLAVEVLSPAEPDRDQIVKKKLYHKFGVKEYWIVDPDARSIEVFVWENAGYRMIGSFTTGQIGSLVFPSLVVNHSDVFAK